MDGPNDIPQPAGDRDLNIPALIGEEELAAEFPAAVGGEEAIVNITGELGRILAVLTAVNDIRDQVIRLGLNPSLRFAIEVEVSPVIGILTALATAADFYSVAAFNLSNINFSKTHEIKKILNLIYDITDLSEDVLEVATKLVLSTLPKSHD
ncbi:hypothetical protein OXPF_14880 [Oxobacter pfennigii]|uniref:Uncharacterized protein n=1 Tax=Oxobacter pfennigii TaxID=36849 RepID=A0A0P8WBB4_9CLOT|nr:hypothetical protein [Oxobacter pfennigii]KPU45010.1 hypothetical protein OXPF_14880 [Oxobacter pfennigii]